MNIRFLIASLVLLAVGGCAEGPKVITDFDPSTQFSAFRTFAFSGITDRGQEIRASDRTATCPLSTLSTRVWSPITASTRMSLTTGTTRSESTARLPAAERFFTQRRTVILDRDGVLNRRMPKAQSCHGRRSSCGLTAH